MFLSFSLSTIAQVKVMNAFKVDTWSYARVDQVDDNQRYVAFLQEGDNVFLSIVNNTSGKAITCLITKIYDKKDGVTMMDLILDGKKLRQVTLIILNKVLSFIL